MFFFFFPLGPIPPELAIVDQTLKLVRLKYPKMTVGTFGTFLHIARRQQAIVETEISLKDLSLELQLTYSTLARHTDILGAGPKGVGGMGLILKANVAGDMKEKKVALTESGAAFFTDILDAINSGLSSPSDHPKHSGPPAPLDDLDNTEWQTKI